MQKSGRNIGKDSHHNIGQSSKGFKCANSQTHDEHPLFWTIGEPKMVICPGIANDHHDKSTYMGEDTHDITGKT